MTKSKFTDEQILVLLRDPQYTSNRQIASALGKDTICGAFHKKLTQLRKENGIPEPERKRGRKAGSTNNQTAKKEVKDIKPPVPLNTETLSFDDIRVEDRLLRNGKRLVVIAVSAEEISVRNMQEQILHFSRKYCEKYASEFTRVSPGDLKGAPVHTYRIKPREEQGLIGGIDVKKPSTEFAYTAENLKENEKASAGMSDAIADAYGLPAKETKKPGMTINPVFEAAVQAMEAQNKAKKETIAPPENVIREAVKSVITEATNVKIDLEMESSSDPVSPFAREPEGYIDPAYSFDRKPEPVKSEIRDYLSDINQLLNILAGDCTEPEMAEQTKKLICYKLVIGFKREIGLEAGA